MPQRIGRLELFIWLAVATVGCGILLVIVAVLTNSPIQTDRTRYPLPQALCLILATVVILRAVVSRFHDIGWSGWAVLLMFIPPVGILVLLFLLIIPGQKQPNAHGEPPIFLRSFRKSMNNP